MHYRNFHLLDIEGPAFETGQVLHAANRLAEIRQRMRKAETDFGRSADNVRLIAVSKTFDSEAIRPMISAGQRHFGENRVQEATRKWPELKEAQPDLTLHLVGPLQSNKAAEAVRLFDVIHTVDRDKIAAAIAAESAKQKRQPGLFAQVNTGGEPQKTGIAAAEAVGFVEHCRTAHGLLIEGLMAIPPAEEAPGLHFALLGKLASEAGLSRLSMGMSNDFETAIALGSTDIRIGRALFGERPIQSENG